MCASYWMERSSENPQLVGKWVIKHIEHWRRENNWELAFLPLEMICM